MDVRVPCLLPMENRAAWSKVIAGVCSIDAVYRILAQITFCRSVLHGLTTKLFKFELIDTEWRLEIKANSPRILADRQRPCLCESDILRNQFQSKVGLRPGCFKFSLKVYDAFDIRRQESRRPSNEFQNIFAEYFAVHTRSDTRDKRLV